MTSLTELVQVLARPAHILVVDDDNGVCRVFQDSLADYDCEAHTATTVVEALAVLRDGQFDIVFLDLHLPDGPGTTILKEIRLLMPAIPVVLMTGFIDSDLIGDAYRVGGIVAFLRKPEDFHQRKLIEMLRLFKVPLRSKSNPNLTSQLFNPVFSRPALA